jgi:hypothetical protein
MKTHRTHLLIAVALVLGLAGCGGSGDGPSKEEVFAGFLANLGGTGQPDAPKIDDVKNFQCEKASGEPGYNCTFDIPGNAISHFQVRAIKGDDGKWTVQ